MGTYNTNVLFGTSELGVFELKNVSVQDRFINAGNQSYYSNTPEGFLGDVNNDGFPDFLLSSTELLEGEESPGIDNYRGMGLIFEYGNSSRDDSYNHELYYSIPATQEPVATFNAGDFNVDGIEDYGVVFENSATSIKKSRIELFFGQSGKTNWGNADLVFQTEDGLKPNYPAIGDFNGDGISDLVINYEHQNSGIYFYWGKDTPDSESDYFISSLEITGFESFDYDYSGFSILGNLRDINGDGIDDLGLSGLHYGSGSNRMNSTYVFFGGETIAKNPDLELTGRVDNLLGLGDIDQDGKNEFLTANVQNDQVTIYEGFNESNDENFNTDTDYIISNNVLDFTIDVRGMGYNSAVGDFNGDGINDVAVSPLLTVEGSRVNFVIYEYNGGTLVYIFYGGEDFDNIPDQQLRVPISNVRSIIGASQTDTETEFISRFTGEINTVSSYNGDTIDELFIGTSTADYLTNVLMLSGDGDTLKTDKIFKAENLDLGLGSQINSDIYKQTYFSVKSAIGDFNVDGKLDFILPQPGDPNFPEDPVLLFRTDLIATSYEPISYTPTSFSLSQNYPNPFNPATQITYSLAKTEKVSLKVYDITGRMVSTLVDEVKAAGNYSLNFNASGLSSGVYFYRLSSSEGIQTKKMTLIK